MDFIMNLIYIIPVVLFAITIHEFAHGYVSYKLGDPTPKIQGRLSLNPINHLDLYGTIMLVFVGFGWAKPVIVNPSYYKNKKMGMVLVALAGPIINIIISFLSVFLLGVLTKVGVSGQFASIISLFLTFMALINLGLAIFNLIPIPPLDGSKILGAIIPEKHFFKFMQFSKYSYIILIILLFSGLLTTPLVFLQSSIIDIFEVIVNFILIIK